MPWDRIPRCARSWASARRPPAGKVDKTTWVAADVVDADLSSLFTGADAVVHLAWLIQPSRDKRTTGGARTWREARGFSTRSRLPRACRRWSTPSSVGAYSPGPKDRRVDESWPDRRHRELLLLAHTRREVERRLDRFEARGARGARRAAATGADLQARRGHPEIRRLFAGPSATRHPLLRPRVDPARSRTPTGSIFQAVHSFDVGEAFRLAVTRGQARGPYNVAADPVLDSRAAGLASSERAPCRCPRRRVRAGGPAPRWPAAPAADRRRAGWTWRCRCR